MRAICSESCRVSACGPHGLSGSSPLRSRACGGLLQRVSSCSTSVCSRHTSSCCSHHSAVNGQPYSRLVVSASQQHGFSSTHIQHHQQQQVVSQQQQQQAVPTATTVASSGAAAQHCLPFAALSRVLLTSSNANVFKTLTQRRQPVSGPMGVLLFLATLIAASFAAIRGLLLKRGKSCKTCRGYGLQRCRLCLGSGRVDWAAKLKHFDLCPLCMNKRFIVCAECGGHYHRTMFAHRRRQTGGAFEPDNSSDSTSGGGYGNDGGFQGPIVLNMAAAGAGAAGVTVVTSGLNVPRGQQMNPVISSMSD